MTSGWRADPRPAGRVLPSAPGRTDLVAMGRSAFLLAAGLILVASGALRLYHAAAMPVMSRDGVVFCWYARDLGRVGPAYLRDPQAQQHPLFPTLILGVARLAELVGAEPTPLLWQRCGQAVAWLSGLAVVVLSGALASTLVRRLELPIDARLATLVAMLLAGLLDLNVGLSADVMSDQTHLALYLAAVLVLGRLDTLSAAIGGGALAGFAFLTRQEGFLPAAAAMLALGLGRGPTHFRTRLARAAAIAVGFVVVAGPYWAVTGRISTKKDPLHWLEHETAAAEPWMPADGASVSLPGTLPPPVLERSGNADIRELGSRRANSVGGSHPPPAPPWEGGGMRASSALAKLETHDFGWYALLPYAAYKTLRAGRVVIPLLAVLPLLNLRSRWRHPALVVVLLCAVGHLGLTTLLLDRYGYLATRHTLVVVALLTPLAAMFVARLAQLAVERQSAWIGLLAAALVCGPLLPYALRTPNARDAHLAVAVARLSETEQPAGRLLVSGASQKRIAYYLDMRWEPWSEDAEDFEDVQRRLVGLDGGYFALETGPGFERRGNEVLLGRLRADPELGPRLEDALELATTDGARLHVLRVGARR